MQAGQVTVLQYGQINPADVVTATESGGVTTFSTAGNADGLNVSIPILITNFNNTPVVGIPAFETFVDVHTTGSAVTASGQIFQSVVGIIKFTSAPGGAGANYLTATFTDVAHPGVLYGVEGGAQITLSATSPPQTFILTSDFALYTVPTSMTLAFSNVTPGLSTGSTTIADFTGQFAGTIGATIVPEPSTLALACIALIFGPAMLRLRRRLRRETANA